MHSDWEACIGQTYLATLAIQKYDARQSTCTYQPLLLQDASALAGCYNMTFNTNNAAHRCCTIFNNKLHSRHSDIHKQKQQQQQQTSVPELPPSKGKPLQMHVRSSPQQP
jgi:hypothetical protein